MSSSASTSGSKKVTLKSSDGQVFEVEEAVARKSLLIKHMIEDDCANDVIPLPKVTSKILSKVIEYCKKHVEMQKPGEDNNPLDEDLKSWDADFIKVDVLTLSGLRNAANYLSIESLLVLTFQTVLDMIKGMTFEEVCKTFALGTDFSPEEEEEVTIKAKKMGLKKVTLKSSDGQVFEVEAAVALKSQTIKHMIEVDCADGVIPLPNVTSNILSKVIEYCEMHVEMKVIEYCEMHVEMQKPGDDEDSEDSNWDDGIWEKRGDWVKWYLKHWDADFIKVNWIALVDLLRAANYLKIGSLQDLTIRAGADSFYKVEGVEEERLLLDHMFS